MKDAKEKKAMIKDLALLRQASALARHAAARHAVVSENLANADTPGFKARDVPRFDADMAAAAANGRFDAQRAAAPSILRGVEASPNGNTVSLEDQMARSVDAQSQHAAALSIYRKTLELLRLSVSAR